MGKVETTVRREDQLEVPDKPLNGLLNRIVA